MNFERVIIGSVILVVVGVIWALVYEATFDYSVCRQTDEYADRHQPMWIQTIPGGCSGSPPICRPSVTIIHPAKDWTERRYECPSDGMEAFKNKWRVEDRPTETAE